VLVFLVLWGTYKLPIKDTVFVGFAAMSVQFCVNCPHEIFQNAKKPAPMGMGLFFNLWKYEMFNHLI